MFVGCFLISVVFVINAVGIIYLVNFITFIIFKNSIDGIYSDYNIAKLRFPDFFPFSPLHTNHTFINEYSYKTDKL